jgi:dihydropteroate synthase-like protein
LKLVLVTTLERLDSSVVGKLRALGYDVEVLSVRSLNPLDVREALRGVSFDYAIVPGTSPYDYSMLGGRVVKGTVSPKTLPYILELVSPNLLSPSVQAEKAVGPKVMIEVSRRVYEDAKTEAIYAFKLGSLGIPLRPPPIIVASDVYIREGRGVDEVLLESAYRYSEGADIVVLSSQPGLSKRVYLDALDRVLSLGKVVAADPASLEVLVDALDMGAHIAMSLTRSSLSEIPGGLRGKAAFVIIPEIMASWRSRVYELRRAYEEALRLGYENLILDPVVNPPVNRGLLQSFIAAGELSEGVRAPIMLGLNNAVEMMDVDSHASIGVLTLLAAESGVSIVMVGEESYKARGSTREAKKASIIASVALKLDTPPKDLGYTILNLKGKSPPGGVQYKGYARFIVDNEEVDCREASRRGEVECGSKIYEVCAPWAEDLSFPSL